MPERIWLADAAEDDHVFVHLNALSMLMIENAAGHPEHERAQRLDRELRPVRDEARKALMIEPRTGPSTARGWSALQRCLTLVDQAGEVIDREAWSYNNLSTRAWAGRCMDVAVAAAAREQRRRGGRSRRG